MHVDCGLLHKEKHNGNSELRYKHWDCGVSCQVLCFPFEHAIASAAYQHQARPVLLLYGYMKNPSEFPSCHSYTIPSVQNIHFWSPQYVVVSSQQQLFTSALGAQWGSWNSVQLLYFLPERLSSFLDWELSPTRLPLDLDTNYNWTEIISFTAGKRYKPNRHCPFLAFS